MSRPWMPLFYAEDERGFPLRPDGRIDGPTRMYGYDGRIYPNRPTAGEWRAHRMRRAKEKGTHTKAEWLELKHRVGRCVACGVDDVELTKDHIIPISRGGCDCIQNIQPMCQPCNTRKCASL